MKEEVSKQWPELESEPLKSCHVGLINQTWFVGEPPAAVLQQVHPIFGPDVHLDIAMITGHLAQKNIVTPRLLKTSSGEWSHEDQEGKLWRMMTYIPGVTVERVVDKSMAFQAGKLVGKWHSAVDDLEHTFHFKRSGVHDTLAHMQRLETALTSNKGHRLFDHVERAAQLVLEQWNEWGGTLQGESRICHGDLKISNLRFDEVGNAISILDLDTMGMMSLDVELGDAWRSWCNQGGEDQSSSEFNVDFLEASLTGYCSARQMTAEEAEGLEWGTERIALELSARFLVDALEEAYFGWDASRFNARGEHNLLRGEGQLSLAQSLQKKRLAITRLMQRVIASPR